ncbi:MAG: HNH endonuclease signature motif containing protein [Nocardioidaceae bacterium]
MSTELLSSWLADATVVVRPVLDLARGDARDAHDPPAWMSELVRLRDRHCVFPGCRRASAHCDLDHIVPYAPDGPPGQTRPDNLAPLCRGHHRAKTHGQWRYRRRGDGSYRWDSPTGRFFEVLPAPRRPRPPRLP